jgi:hypothetical protein
MEIELLAASIATTLAPFTPYLVEAGKESAKKLAAALVEKGGPAAWKKAQGLWEKIQTHFGDDPKLKGAALMVSAEPADETLQKMLASILSARLNEKPELADELLAFLGGPGAVQKILADHKSAIQDVTQELTGPGEQTIKAERNSRISGVKQIKK